MDRLPRLLVLIGSGEMAPLMTRGHRMVARRLLEGRDGSRTRDIRAAVIDTPYGFQENADDLSETLLDYFGRRIGMSAAIATFRRSDDDVLSREAAFARVREADFVFSGPGSPSYALRHWAGSALPDLLTDKLVNGGAVVFASAAALTLGSLTVPVYEIYKCGDEPRWLPGLDVLGAIGIKAAVIPHFDNAEGGTHDTRYCYVGERRLLLLEDQLPDDGTFILGVDEHTAMLVDIDAGTAVVHGRGGITLRKAGVERRIDHGKTVDLKELQTEPMKRTRRDPGASKSVARRTGREAALAQRVLALENERISGRERERLVEPLIQALVDVRDAARERGDYPLADAIRKRMVTLGVDISDSPAGTSARLRVGKGQK